MTTFALTIFAGFGIAWVLSRLRGGQKTFVFVAVLALLLFELRASPHLVEPVWAGENVPEMLKFVRSLPAADLVAAVPQDDGAPPFVGDAGMAFHNYLALYHKHRFVNGQSSWLPAVTELAWRSLRALPDEASRRALVSIGTRHLLIYGNQLSPVRRGLPSVLAARPDRYRRIYSAGGDSVISLLDTGDSTLELMALPELPEGARQIPPGELTALGHPAREEAQRAIDGNLETRWDSGRPLRRGDYLELQLSQARKVIALEIENPGHPFDAPPAFRLDAAQKGGGLEKILARPQVRLYREQVFSPKTFVFRLVFDVPVELDRLRLTGLKGFAGYYFSAAEVRLYAP
jgi:hypothetical protein